MKKYLDFRNRKGVKTLAVIMSISVYLSFIIYSEVHFYNLLTHFLPAKAAIVGIFAVSVTAVTSIALPLSIHYWVRSGKQLVTAWLFYAVHFVFIVFNLIVDSAANSALASGTAVELSGFFVFYSAYILPASVAVYALGWVAVWGLDSTAQRAEMKEEVNEQKEDAKASQELSELRLEAQKAQTNAEIDILVSETEGKALIKGIQSPQATEAIERIISDRVPDIIADRLGIHRNQLDTQGIRWWLSSSDEQQAPTPEPEPVVAPRLPAPEWVKDLSDAILLLKRDVDSLKDERVLVVTPDPEPSPNGSTPSA